MPASPAARIAGWLKTYGTWPGISIPAGSPEAAAFPQVPLAVNVAIWVDESWIDITLSVYGGNRANIQITRGIPNEGSTVDPAKATFEINNRDGQFSPRNPMSWLYGKIGRGTMIRVAIGADVRFCGEVSDWPQRWDKTGADGWVLLEANGIMRRLSQGTLPVKSPLRRALSASSSVKAYWPVEDAENSTSIASAIGGPPMSTLMTGNVYGAPTYAADSGFVGSAPVATFSTTQWTGTVPSYSGHSGEAQVWFLMHVPTAGAINGEGIIRVRTTGTAAEWRIAYLTGGQLQLTVYDADNTVIDTSIIFTFSLDGDYCRVALQLDQNGANIDWSVSVLTVGASGLVGSNTIVGYNFTSVSSVVMNPGAELDDIAIGHIAVHDEILDPFEFREQLEGWNGETAGDRLTRLAEEEGVDFQLIGEASDTAQMGAQPIDTLVKLLTEAAAADGGILYEQREECALAYRTRESLHNQQPTLTLDYSAADLSTIEHTDDDQRLRNDITVQREGGSSARAIEATGPLSVEAPPNGVGKYDEEVTLNLHDETTLDDRAGWLLHLGTVDEPRYPRLGVNLARTNFTGAGGNIDKATNVRQLDVGDRLVVENPPLWVAPEDITQLALGFSETLRNFEHTIEVNCAPESPWGAAGQYDNFDQRYTSDGSTLAAALDTTTTSVSVATATGPLWAYNDGDYSIVIGGEAMTVTGVAGATSPQTFTVTRSVNGVVKSHASGADVELLHPAVFVP